MRIAIVATIGGRARCLGRRRAGIATSFKPDGLPVNTQEAWDYSRKARATARPRPPPIFDDEQ